MTELDQAPQSDRAYLEDVRQVRRIIGGWFGVSPREDKILRDDKKSIGIRLQPPRVNRVIIERNIETHQPEHAKYLREQGLEVDNSTFLVTTYAWSDYFVRNKLFSRYATTKLIFSGRSVGALLVDSATSKFYRKATPEQVRNTLAILQRSTPVPPEGN